MVTVRSVMVNLVMVHTWLGCGHTAAAPEAQLVCDVNGGWAGRSPLGCSSRRQKQSKCVVSALASRMRSLNLFTADRRGRGCRGRGREEVPSEYDAH